MLDSNGMDDCNYNSNDSNDSNHSNNKSYF